MTENRYLLRQFNTLSGREDGHCNLKQFPGFANFEHAFLRLAEALTNSSFPEIAESAEICATMNKHSELVWRMALANFLRNFHEQQDLRERARDALTTAGFTIDQTFSLISFAV